MIIIIISRTLQIMHFANYADAVALVLVVAVVVVFTPAR